MSCFTHFTFFPVRTRSLQCRFNQITFSFYEMVYPKSGRCPIHNPSVPDRIAIPHHRCGGPRNVTYNRSHPQMTRKLVDMSKCRHRHTNLTHLQFWVCMRSKRIRTGCDISALQIRSPGKLLNTSPHFGKPCLTRKKHTNQIDKHR